MTGSWYEHEKRGTNSSQHLSWIDEAWIDVTVFLKVLLYLQGGAYQLCDFFNETLTLPLIWHEWRLGMSETWLECLDLCSWLVKASKGFSLKRPYQSERWTCQRFSKIRPIFLTGSLTVTDFFFSKNPFVLSSFDRCPYLDWTELWKNVLDLHN